MLYSRNYIFLILISFFCNLSSAELGVQKANQCQNNFSFALLNPEFQQRIFELLLDQIQKLPVLKKPKLNKEREYSKEFLNAQSRYFKIYNKINITLSNLKFKSLAKPEESYFQLLDLLLTKDLKDAVFFMRKIHFGAVQSENFFLKGPDLARLLDILLTKGEGGEFKFFQNELLSQTYLYEDLLETHSLNLKNFALTFEQAFHFFKKWISLAESEEELDSLAQMFGSHLRVPDQKAWQLYSEKLTQLVELEKNKIREVQWESDWQDFFIQIEKSNFMNIPPEMALDALDQLKFILIRDHKHYLESEINIYPESHLAPEVNREIIQVFLEFSKIHTDPVILLKLIQLMVECPWFTPPEPYPLIQSFFDFSEKFPEILLSALELLKKVGLVQEPDVPRPRLLWLSYEQYFNLIDKALASDLAAQGLRTLIQSLEVHIFSDQLQKEKLFPILDRVLNKIEKNPEIITSELAKEFLYALDNVGYLEDQPLKAFNLGSKILNLYINKFQSYNPSFSYPLKSILIANKENRKVWSFLINYATIDPYLIFEVLSEMEPVPAKLLLNVLADMLEGFREKMIRINPGAPIGDENSTEYNVINRNGRILIGGGLFGVRHFSFIVGLLNYKSLDPQIRSILMEIVKENLSFYGLFSQDKSAEIEKIYNLSIIATKENFEFWNWREAFELTYWEQFIKNSLPDQITGVDPDLNNVVSFAIYKKLMESKK